MHELFFIHFLINILLSTEIRKHRNLESKVHRSTSWRETQWPTCNIYWPNYQSTVRINIPCTREVSLEYKIYNNINKYIFSSLGSHREIIKIFIAAFCVQNKRGFCASRRRPSKTITAIISWTTVLHAKLWIAYVVPLCSSVLLHIMKFL